MEGTELAIGGVLTALAIAAYKRWGSKWVKKWFDDPKTKEDESAMLDGFAQDVIKIATQKAIHEAAREARKNPKLDQAMYAAEKLAGQFKGQISEEDAKKLVDKALGLK